jgi:hypothetical protein
MNRSLRIVLVLIGINAAIAIATLLSGELGDTQGRILGTSLLLTAGAVLVLACVPALSANRAGYWPHLGIAAAVVGTVTLIIGVWAEPSEVVWQLGGSGMVLAVASALVSILSPWTASGGLSWIRPAVGALAAITAAMIIIPIWSDLGRDSGAYWRTFAIVAVLLAAAAIATPIAHRMTASESPDTIAHCPFCGADLSSETGKRTTCGTCGRVFEVEAA